MNFNFIPYRLNADLTDFGVNIQYISTDNGIELCKVMEGHIKPLLGIEISDTNLYFFEGGLITVCIHLAENPEKVGYILNILETTIEERKMAFKTDVGIVYDWVIGTELLGLVNDEKGKKLYLYYSLKEFSVF